MHTVAVAVMRGVPVLELAVPCQVFGVDHSDLGVPWYELRLCAAEEGPVQVAHGFAVSAPYGLAELIKADTVIVPACENVFAGVAAPLVEALRQAHARGARIASICTGAFVLAAAGLLDGRRATTHWMRARALARRYPQVKVDPAVLYVDEGNILTSAGTAAGIDLCLHLIRKDHGARVAAAVARRLVVAPHREGGQAQYVDLPVQVPGDAFGPVLEWALRKLDQPLTVTDLAQRAGTSTRTFARRFLAVTGTTPLQWLIGQRIRLAQGLLESTDEPVERIAGLCGFATAPSMRHHFTRRVGLPPHAYRKAFRAGNGSRGPGSGRRQHP